MTTHHGTSVLGEVLMVDNTIGGVGIAPSAKGRVISLWRTDSSPNTARCNLADAYREHVIWRCTFAGGARRRSGK